MEDRLELTMCRYPACLRIISRDPENAGYQSAADTHLEGPPKRLPDCVVFHFVCAYQIISFARVSTTGG